MSGTRDAPKENVEVLENLARLIKEGSHIRALLDFEIKFPAGIRKHTLLGLGRGYEKISAKESAREFKLYLKEFATSGSKITDTVPQKAWGSNDTLATISTLLQKDIFVINISAGMEEPGVIHYAPETRNRKNNCYMMSGEYPM